MKLLRYALSAALVLAIGAAAQADDKKDAKGKTNAEKIVGTWVVVSSELPAGVEVTIEFTKDGKLNIGGKAGDKAIPTETGTYNLTGDSLKTAPSGGSKAIKTETMKIKSLTDKELITVDAQGKEDKFKRK